MLDGYVCAAITFRRASVAVLSKLQKENPGREALLYAGLSEAREAVVLQTCNRFEVYAYSEEPGKAAAKLAAKLREEAGVEPEVYTGVEAVRHLFRVASSLDSMVVGEYEILGQVADASRRASETGAAGPMLKALFDKAVHVGRRVRAETSISKGPVSIARIAVEEALHEAREPVVVVGAGRVGSMLARYLGETGVKNVVIVNRTLEKAKNLAERLGYDYAPLDALPELLRQAGLVFVATSAPNPVITRRMLEEAGSTVVYDLSTHGNVERPYGTVVLRTIDDLKTRAEENKARREKEARAAEEIIEEEIVLFERNTRRREASELLKPLLGRAEVIRRGEMERALRALGCENSCERILDAMTRSIVNKVLAPLLEVARTAADRGDETLLRALRSSLSGLEDSSPSGKK